MDNIIKNKYFSGGKMSATAAVSTQKRDKLIQAFHDAQDQNQQNYISQDQIKTIAREFGLSLAEVSGVLSFYTMFSTQPRGKYIIRLCDSLSCRVCGSVDMFLHLSQKLGIKNHETSQDGLFTLELVNCLGGCDTAPNMMINNDSHGNMTPEKIDQIIDELKGGEHV
jgi:NADH-quinone oxidoreductase E subunit